MSASAQSLETLAVPSARSLIYKTEGDIEVYTYQDAAGHPYVITVFYSLHMNALRPGVEAAIGEIKRLYEAHQKPVRYVSVTLFSLAIPTGANAFAALGQQVRVLRRFIHDGVIEGRIVLINFGLLASRFAAMLEKGLLGEEISVSVNNWPEAVATFTP